MSPLERLALLSVPRDWRRAIAAAMQDEEADRSPIWRAAHIARIGGRLRLARGRDVLVTTIQGASPMRDSLRDLRLALRGLRRQPAQAAAIVATLAIGIGASTGGGISASRCPGRRGRSARFSSGRNNARKLITNAPVMMLWPVARLIWKPRVSRLFRTSRTI